MKEEIQRMTQKYKLLYINIRRAYRKAKENWLKEKCRKIESLQEKYDTFNVHRKIRKNGWKISEN